MQRFNQHTKYLIVHCILSIWGFSFVAGFEYGKYSASKKTTPEIETRPTPKEQPAAIELNKCNLLAELKKQGVHYPHIVFAQSMIESAHLTSNVCLTRNNLFGMHNPTVRKSKTVAKKGEKYAKFATWQDAVQDMKLWQEMHHIKGYEFTDAQYITFLRSSGYIAGADKDYEKLLTKIKIPKCQD